MTDPTATAMPTRGHAAGPGVGDQPASPPPSPGEQPTREQVLGLSETLLAAFRMLKGDEALRGASAAAVDPSLLPVLGSLDAGALRVGELAERLHGDMSTISRQVSHLVESGHAIKQPNPGDRRVMEVSLTDRGRRALARARASRTERLHQLVGDWSSGDIADFQQHLERLAHASAPAGRLAG